MLPWRPITARWNAGKLDNSRTRYPFSSKVERYVITNNGFNCWARLGFLLFFSFLKAVIKRGEDRARIDTPKHGEILHYHLQLSCLVSSFSFDLEATMASPIRPRIEIRFESIVSRFHANDELRFPRFEPRNPSLPYLTSVLRFRAWCTRV